MGFGTSTRCGSATSGSLWVTTVFTASRWGSKPFWADRSACTPDQAAVTAGVFSVYSAHDHRPLHGPGVDIILHPTWACSTTCSGCSGRPPALGLARGNASPCAWWMCEWTPLVALMLYAGCHCPGTDGAAHVDGARVAGVQVNDHAADQTSGPGAVLIRTWTR